MAVNDLAQQGRLKTPGARSRSLDAFERCLNQSCTLGRESSSHCKHIAASSPEAARHLGVDPDFVIHSLRHTMLTRLGESGADAFTIKRIAGQHSISVSERYVHATPEHVERMFERFEAYGLSTDAMNNCSLLNPTKVPTVESAQSEPINVLADVTTVQ